MKMKLYGDFPMKKINLKEKEKKLKNQGQKQFLKNKEDYLLLKNRILTKDQPYLHQH